jgi:hypothetical protein
MNYFEVDAFNVSYLKTLQGAAFYGSPEALRLGTQFDNLVSGVANTEPIDAKVWDMYKRYLDTDIGNIMVTSNPKFQHEIYRHINIRGVQVLVKCKPDFYVKGFMQIDMKTTAATTIAGIHQSIEAFDYIMQMGFYHHVARVKHSGLFFFSKNSTLTHFYKCTPAELEAGYNKAISILDKHLVFNGILPPLQ